MKIKIIKGKEETVYDVNSANAVMFTNTENGTFYLFDETVDINVTFSKAQIDKLENIVDSICLAKTKELVFCLDKKNEVFAIYY